MREDEFTERAVREHVKRLILRTMREEPFLGAVRGAGWLTLGGVVKALDASGYWAGRGWANLEPPEEPPAVPAGKRKHAREMIEHLSPDFGDTPTREDLHGAVASAFKANDAGGIERHFKVLGEMTFEELEEVREGHEAEAEYHGARRREHQEALAAIRRGEKVPSVSEVYLSELSEATMLRAWPGLDHEKRVAVADLGKKLRGVVEQIKDDLVREHGAGRLPSAEQAEAFVGERMGGAWEAFAEDLSDRGWPEDEARRYLAQPALRAYATEFSEVLGNSEDDSYGWTLDEHLRFVVDERELDQARG